MNTRATRTGSRLRRCVLPLALASTVLAACGDDDPDDGAATTSAASASTASASTSVAAPEATEATSGDSTTEASEPSGPATGEPLVIGAVGTWSGPVAANVKPIVDMLEVWAEDVNARGGLDGHPVELVVVDDGGDPARHLAAVRDLVENRNAFAFAGNAFPISYSDGLRTYLEEQGVPVVGGSISHEVWDQSPVFFPQGTSFGNFAPSHVAATRALRPDATKWGQLTCREADACRALAAAWPQIAETQGFEIAYTAEVSLAEPDFTAQCLAAKDAGVEVMAVGMDSNSIQRLAQSCARQDFRPTFILPQSGVTSSQTGDANFEGSIGVFLAAPWMAMENDAIAAMHAAVEKYAPDLALNTNSTSGWAAGLMLEEAVRKAGGLGEVPSRERLIEGLNQFTDETLGGVSPPLTFRAGETRDTPCWFVVEFVDGDWTAANNGQHQCPNDEGGAS